MRKKIFFAFLIVLSILFLVTACENSDHEAVKTIPTGIVTGQVTDGRGGPGVEDAVISWMNYSTKTDKNGYFELEIAANNVADLFVKKGGRGTVRIQDVLVGEGTKIDFEIPSRRTFNPNRLSIPPEIIVNKAPGDELTGVETIEISISGEYHNYVTYLYLGGEQRKPYDGIITEEDGSSFDIDTRNYPNGLSYLKVLAYDGNDNTAIYKLPIKIFNSKPGEIGVELPGGMDNFTIKSSSFGKNYVLYKEERENLYDKLGLAGDPEIIKLPNGIEFNLKAAPADAMIFNLLEWEPADDADGYEVYRSFDGVKYDLIGRVISPYYDDFSPKLEVNKKTYYRIVPYNSAGEGIASERYVIPIPSFNVYLEGPANGAVGVSLEPTLSWRNEVSSKFPQGTIFESGVWIFDGTDYEIWENYTDDNECTVPAGILDPGGVYSWDVFYSIAYVEYSRDNTGYSLAMSAAGEYTSDGFGNGSLNGEFIFTTTDNIE